MNIIRLIFVAGVLLLFNGCKSDSYYQDQTVRKAREYAIENLPELSEQAKHEVNYTIPRFYQKRLFVRGSGKEDSKRDVVETCVIWKLPEDTKKCIVVFGVGQRRLNDWYPSRVLIKAFEPPLPADAKAEKNDDLESKENK